MYLTTGRRLNGKLSEKPGALRYKSAFSGVSFVRSRTANCREDKEASKKTSGVLRFGKNFKIPGLFGIPIKQKASK